jgi:hypothetical protein
MVARFLMRAWWANLRRLARLESGLGPWAARAQARVRVGAQGVGARGFWSIWVVHLHMYRLVFSQDGPGAKSGSLESPRSELPATPPKRPASGTKPPGIGLPAVGGTKNASASPTAMRSREAIAPTQHSLRTVGPCRLHAAAIRNAPRALRGVGSPASTTPGRGADAPIHGQRRSVGQHRTG